MNNYKPTLVLLLVILFSFNLLSQTTFTENAAAYGLNIPNPKDGGHAWADFDNDGDQDVLINFNSTSIRNYLMRNNGDGTFTNVQPSLAPGMVAGALAERQAAWGDVNNDGRTDFMMNSAGYPTQGVAIQIFIQNADGTFGNGIGGTAPITVGRAGMIVVNPINAEGAGFFDFEGDGDLDIFFDSHDYGIELLRNNYIDHTTHTVVNPAPGALYTHITPGNGSGVIEQGLNQYATDGDYGTSADVNDDGWVDIFMRKRNENDFFLNQGGTFTNGADLGQAYNSNKGANGLWDLDNDGDLDAVWTENGVTQIHRNDGPGVWTALGGGVFPALPQPANTDAGTSSAGIDALAGGDIDNDGDIDVLLVGDNRSYLYINQLNSPTPAPGVIGSGSAMSFTLDSQTFNTGQDGEGTTFIDIDNDGDLDIYMNINNSANQLYINNLAAANRNNHLLIDVTEDRAADGSTGGFAGRVAIGTNVLIKDCEGNIISGLRQVAGVYGHGTQIPEEVHFGLPLGENETYLIEVHYPNFYDPTDGIRRLYATAIAQPSTIAGTNHYSLTTTDAENIQNDNAPDAVDDFELIASSDSISVQLNLFDNDSDADGDSIYIESIVQPAVGSVVIDDANAGLVTYTYNVSGTPFTGTSFEYTISDAIILCYSLGKKDTAKATLFINPPASAMLDFDGIDDYVENVNSVIDGLNEYTISCWFKYDGPAITSSAGEAFVLGQKDLFEITVRDWGSTQPEYEAIGVNIFRSNGLSQGSGWRFVPGEWTHVAVTVSFDGTDTTYKIFRNGYASGVGSVLGTINTNSNPFRMGIANGTTSYTEFEGAIDEVRIFNKVLADDQIQRMVYQEIENNAGFVKGTEIDKDIIDIKTDSKISWSDLITYYSVNNIADNKVLDESLYYNDAVLYNIFSLQPQTAPMPYETISDGNWNDESTWLHGDIWDIESLDTDFGSSDQNPEPWSIVKVHHDITSNTSRRNLGLFIDADKSLTINGDNSVINNWYLQLDGTLDLQNDSQLIQTENSDLVTSANGKILRRQEGNTNYYWYNYWSSPVGSLATTVLSDNNSGNNINNKSFSLNMLKDGTGSSIDFTSSYHEAGKVSTYWLYNFQNGITYWNWTALDQNSAIQPGFGYTQKGTGNAGTEQEYIFEGKPNNGTILIVADDVDGDSANESEKDVTMTTTLIGNPYPSALDARLFIADNSGVIGGTILLWEQWAGNSHNLNQYEGGYGYINALTTVRAYQHADIPIADQAQPNGIKTPTFYLPVGQGFFVEVIEDGNIEFNNRQRVFKKENLGESVFYRSSNNESSTNTQDISEENAFQLIKLEFATSQGTTRRFAIGFGEQATEGFDYGLDGGVVKNIPEDDMGSLLNGKQYVIQALSPITDDKIVDLNFKASGSFSYSIKAVLFENIPANQDIFLKDNLTGEYFDLKNGMQYDFNSDAGEFADRFDIVFQSAETLSSEEFENDDTLIFVNQLENKLFIKKLVDQAKQLSIYNMTGQTIKSFNKVDNSMLESGLDISNLSSGVYLVNLKTENNLQISKKIILE